ncbi:DUF1501 domain-containing protein [Cognatilysobacter bugurensis]|uniref:DUF1501 domain-containing protein n=1 Tax=Cognatilysobacter bugurensis TaxID=543356 RepID=A0A918T0A2_9GAMM|nr:DUF1501 domain-containing protein [Lysobacter bugurensis]GHA81556.1 hypothetical protein GCM10007067_19250 [Lysobacter bugurensis]
MDTPSISRRHFLKGCTAAAAVAAAGPQLFFSSVHAAANGHDTLVVLFLRGGLDGLNLVVPVSGEDRAHYEAARPTLAIPVSGTYGALPLTLASGAATGFGLHPSAVGLRDLWDGGQLAIVHACGLRESVTRSHFDAQLTIELGVMGRQGIGTGWLARAMNTQPGVSGAEPMPALAVNSRQPASFGGSTHALTMASPGDFQLNSGAWNWQKTRADSPAGLVGVNETLARLWGGPTGLEGDGARAERALSTIARQSFGAPPAGWPTSTIARQLWTVAQSIRAGLGLRYAALDLGGWDTHDGQGSAGSGYHYFQNKVAELSQALAAFHNELALTGHAGRVTTVVQSEFGRRVRENAARGTDHGYGNPVLVLGGAVNGRRFYGQWPGLSPETLSPTYGDVPVTTDYRQVIGEILVRRMGHTDVAAVFPGYAASALGIVRSVSASAAGPVAVSVGATRADDVSARMPREYNSVFARVVRALRRLFGARPID